MPTVADLKGLWRRSMIQWPDGRCDRTTRVHWLQGPCTFSDLRQPDTPADLAHIRSLADLTMPDCLRLAQQEGFAGWLRFDGTHFEWARNIDFQPQQAWRDIGTLQWRGDVLVETGRDLPYVEHWHRDATAENLPAAALWLRDAGDGCRGMLLRVGARFMFARDRTAPLPPAVSLQDCVAGAELAAAQGLLDCEISCGIVREDRFHIEASTLPHRVGQPLGQRLIDNRLSMPDVDARGAHRTRRWEMMDGEGETGALCGGEAITRSVGND